MANTNIPELRLDGESGRYCVHYRNEKGKPARKRFTRDERESRILYAAWVARRYGVQIEGFVPPPDDQDQCGLVTICLAHVDEQNKRRRADDEKRKPGTICTRQYHAIVTQTDKILDWAKEHFGEDRIRRVPFGQLWDVQSYNAMMQSFTRKYDSLSQINKHRIRFWAIADFASLPPYKQVLPFTKKQVQKAGGKEKPKDWVFPTPDQMRALLKVADTRMRCWIWMALAMGFGPEDLSLCQPCSFDQTDFNYTRPKPPNVHRYGAMRPMAWSWIQKYLSAHPRKPDELMFVNKNGLAFNRDETKTEAELEFGTSTHDAKPIPYKHTDGIGTKWRDLLHDAGVQIEGGFYLLRHVACTALANRPNTSPGDLVTFMGHIGMGEMRKYLMPLSPQRKPIVTWVNAMLDCADLMAWDLEPSKVLATLQQGGSLATLLAAVAAESSASRARQGRKAGPANPGRRRRPWA